MDEYADVVLEAQVLLKIASEDNYQLERIGLGNLIVSHTRTCKRRGYYGIIT